MDVLLPLRLHRLMVRSFMQPTVTKLEDALDLPFTPIKSNCTSPWHAFSLCLSSSPKNNSGMMSDNSLESKVQELWGASPSCPPRSLADALDTAAAPSPFVPEFFILTPPQSPTSSATSTPSTTCSHVPVHNLFEALAARPSSQTPASTTLADAVTTMLGTPGSIVSPMASLGSSRTRLARSSRAHA